MKKDVYNLSKPQESIWLTEQYFKDTTINHILCYVDFSTKVDMVDFDILKKALNIMIEKNDAFQTRLFVENGTVKQYFCNFEKVDFPIHEISSLDDFVKESNHTFNLIENPLYEFKVFKYKGTNTGGVLANFHHIISDAISTALATRQFTESYNSLVSGDSSATINPDNYSYIQYLDNEKDYLQSEKFQKDKAYWDKVYETVPEVATIFSNKNSKNSLDCIAERLTFSLDKNLTEKINKLCQDLKISAYNFFMAVFGVYISKTSRLDDFAVGTPILNRTNFKEKNTLGMYISTIPFRITLNSTSSFKDFVSNIAKDSLSMLRHQKYSYQYIIESLRKKDSSIPNLYNILVSYQVNKAADEDCNYTTGWFFNNCTSNDLDIHIYDFNTANSMNISYDYNLNRFDKSDIDLIHPRILHIINQILDNNDILLENIIIVTPEEKNIIIHDFNNTFADYPKDKSIVNLFEETVTKNPDKVALVSNKIKLTYKELNELSNKLAHKFIDSGISQNDIIGIMVNRSPELIISLLAIIKCGATYLPIDPEYPKDRIKYILNNSKAKLLLVNNNTINLVDDEYNKLDISLSVIESLEYSSDSINSKCNFDDTMYMIYTSGTTGNPKGVTVSYGNVHNLIYAMKDIITFSPEKVMVSVTTICFDIFGFEVWCSLTEGITLVLANEKEQNLASYLNTLCLDNKVSIMQTTPSRYLKMLNEDDNLPFLHNLTDIVAGGEPFPIKLLNYFNDNLTANIFNGYGPSETTIYSTFKYLSHLNKISIGRPVANTTCYILDDNLNVLPYNVPGTLYIGGSGVSKGYNNNPTLTNEKFINSPFKDGETIYNTNDLAYWTENGEIVHIGRNDFQVKLNGYRVELSEVEDFISDFPNVDKSVVKYDINTKKLYAFYTTKNDINVNDLRAFLLEKLPPYMIPYKFIKLDKFSYSPNGKLDKKSLDISLYLGTETLEVINPSTDTEKKLYSLIKGILKIEDFSLAENVFSLGMDSINTLNLSIKIEDTFGKKISTRDIMSSSSILDLAKLVDNLDDISIKSEIVANANSHMNYPVSCAQRRIYYADTVALKGNVVYNVSGGAIFDEILDANKAETALNELIKIHPSFRTIFKYDNGEVVQTILENVSIKLEFEQSTLDAQTLVDKFPKAFDLSKAPLLRAKLYILNNKSSLLILDSHHIIIDGTSLSIIFDDFCKLYDGKQLKEENIKYVDYAVWENKFLASEEIKPYKDFWNSKFKNADFTTLNLPYDFPLSNVKSYKGDRLTLNISKSEFEALENFAKKNNVSSYSVFLAALYILLYKYTAQNDILVGSPFAGRNLKEVQDIVGMFVNNMVFNNHIDDNLNISDFIQTIHKDVLDSISNQPYPYELLQKDLNLGTNNPLLDVMFTYQNIAMANAEINGKSAKFLVPNTKTAKFNLWFEIIPTTATFNLEFNTDLFKFETAEGILKHYLYILNQLVHTDIIKVSDFSIITDEESKLLDKFNDTYMDISDDTTIVSLFEEQVLKTPDDIAAVCDDVSLTYDELNKKANSLAHYLINYGIKENDIVCIMTNRSLETIVSMLGILKAGAAFFNVDPTYPIDRTKYYIADSKTEYVLTQRELKDKVKQIKNTIEIDLDNFKIYNDNFENPNVKPDKNSLSYIIYTSGSTGEPKGVMLNQIGFANMAMSMTYALDYLRDGKKHAIASVTSTPFDIFVYEIFVSLTHGMKVVMANNSEHRNPKLLDTLIKKHGVDVMTVTPSLMKINYDNREKNTALARVKNMVFGGEPLPQKFVDDLRALADDITVINIYGPSEITILCNVQNLDGEKEITVGPPTKNTQIHIVDKDMNRVPIGVAGEICVSGIQVGLGYINKPERTSKVFLDNPFGEGKIYKTGDIGRWTFDGKVQVLGRIDHQVKLRGLRIELRRNRK